MNIRKRMTLALWAGLALRVRDRVMETLAAGPARRAFWERLIDWDYLVETGMISPEDVNLFRYVESAEEAWGILRNEYGLGKPDDIACGW